MGVEKKLDIAVVGLSCVDCIGSCETREWDVKHSVRNLRFSFGGVGNALIALSGLGLRVGLSTRIGTDIYGDFLLNHWNALGIDRSGVVRDASRSTGYAFIVDHGSERTPFYAAGANDAFCLEDIPKDFYEDSRCMLIFFAGALPSLDGGPMLDLVRRCHNSGTIVIMDVSDGIGADYDGLHSYMPYVNLVVNSEEGRRITNEESPGDILRSLYDMSKQDGKNGFVAVTRSEGVAIAASRDGARHYVDVPSPFYGMPVHNVVGAGDALRAGLAAYICRHYEKYTRDRLDYRQACIFASAVSYMHLSRDVDVYPFDIRDIDKLITQSLGPYKLAAESG